ncbi:ROK family transcriptional regulator [Streptomyces sp. NPDC097619]|uniref:ROK family transcriptional regulator n=1 Tax=Streptomyces sp. NPDC097619 TaxID=3157228 RepID=UPI00331A08BF
MVVRRGLDVGALRSHNAGLVLGLLRAAGPAGVSRLELAAGTGLTPQAVSKITARLRAEGLVAEAGRRASTGGKPTTVLTLVPGAGHAVGLHLDRDEFRAVAVDLWGRVVAERRGALDFEAGAAAVLPVAVRAVAGVRADPAVPASGLLGVGCAVPGPLDHRGGVLGRVTGATAWEGFPLRAALTEALGAEVALDKDTNAAAVRLAAVLPPAVPPPATGASTDPHAHPGAGPGPAPLPPAVTPGGDFVYVHLGTGLGAGIVLDGRSYRGPRGGAGEFGHQVLLLDGPPCRCGARGCVEALCLDAVDRGDEAGAARLLGEATANLVALLDVDRVVLGGRTLEAAAETYVSGVARVLAARAPGPYRVPVALAPSGTVAAGAAELVLAGLFTRPGPLPAPSPLHPNARADPAGSGP